MNKILYGISTLKYLLLFSCLFKHVLKSFHNSLNTKEFLQLPYYFVHGNLNPN